MQKCRKNAKYNNAKLKIVSNVARGPSCLSFPKPLGAVPLDMAPFIPRASRRGLSNAKIPKYTKIPKCQNVSVCRCGGDITGIFLQNWVGNNNVVI